MTRIPRHKLTDFINKKIHLAGFDPGCVFVLMRVTEDDVMYLRFPSRKGKMRALAHQACYLAKDDPNGRY